MLENALKDMLINVTSFAVCDIRRGWPLQTPPLGTVSLHYVLHGKGSMVGQNHHRTLLNAGSLVICPPDYSLTIDEVAGEPFGINHCTSAHSLHWIRSHTDTTLPGVLILCGLLEVDSLTGGSPFDRLNIPVHLENTNADIQHLFHQLFQELALSMLGTTAMLEAIMKQCFILLLRELQANAPEHPWLLTLEAPELHNAIEAMTQHKGQRLNIDQLAERCHMSRTVFIERFKRAFGMPPQRYSNELRLRHAARLLNTTSLPVKRIAERCGYLSRSQFSAAFKTKFGNDPDTYRKKSTSISHGN
ncbi:AraC family transcriptional regulator [Vreelandella andesensis]|uniref:AraC family transcriptional regulator n=1 Tax=Vreelandella andesensis TaxID=447567 RepID=A0A433KZB0_9GAMM|nr:AraC family transcriptional regulator [Halomonas andesensis]RUR34820.1 AraC family transcriptional regulator [Halomonas andesensis]